MSTTFELAQIKNQFIQILELTGGELDEEKEKQLELVEKALAGKADSCHHVMGMLKAQESFLRDEAKRLMDYANAMKKSQERLTERLLEIVKTSGPLTGDTIEFDLKKNPPKLVIDREQDLPKEYASQVITYEIDKAKLKEDLKNGTKVSGAHLEQGLSLSKRRPRK